MSRGPGPTRHFCTLFDRNYLCRGLALYRSLARHCPDFVLHVLCMDALTLDLLRRLALPSLALIPLSDFEDPELLRVKPSRSAGEYCWTCTPSLPLHVLERVPEADLVTYLDADLFFFASPEPVFAEASAGSVTVHEHRYSAGLEHLQAESGRFNVGWVGFRRDEEALACLRRWRSQCLEWCFARAEAGKFGDQRYLEEWPGRYRGLHILEHKGAGLGPWNIARHAVGGAPGRVLVDDVEVVFYHFHGFKVFDDLTTRPANEEYTLSPEALRLIYAPYGDAMSEALREVRAISPGFAHGLEPASRAGSGRRRMAARIARRLTSTARALARWLCTGERGRP